MQSAFECRHELAAAERAPGVGAHPQRFSIRVGAASNAIGRLTQVASSAGINASGINASA